MNRRMSLTLVTRLVIWCLAAGMIFCTIINCNLFSSIATITPIQTSIPVDTKNNAVPTIPTSPASYEPDETFTVGTLPTSIPKPRKSTSQPTPIQPLTPLGERAPEELLNTVRAGEPVTITFIHMVTSESGWGVGNTGRTSGHILRTDDGGESWWDVSPPEAGPVEGEEKRAETFVLDNNTAWVGYEPYETIWFTKDGGKTWGESGTDTAGYGGAKFWFADQDLGWLMIFIDAGMSHVYTALFRTTTGGKNWENIVDPSDNDELQSFNKTGMVFIERYTGWVTRDSGGVKPGAFVDVTLDGGITWQSLNLPPPEENPKKFDREYCRMHSPTLFSDISGALIVACISYEGDEMTETAYLFSTSDGGKNWKRFGYPGGHLHFIDQRTAFALGREIFRTQDGGLTWEQIKRVEWDGQFSFVNEQQAWAVARRGAAVALVKTQDGCRTWEQLEPEVAAGGD
ncbi:MAG: hypothetical protein MUO67_15025 [Anaerolineales bacterium]|nr:hypothetical protein [Anaerolineales bacterium]